MAKLRDRHNRGMRGPLSTFNPYTKRPVQIRVTDNTYFETCVEQSLQQIKQRCPQALAGIEVKTQAVPYIPDDWYEPQVPLATAAEHTEKDPAVLVVYRRPLQRRASGREDLALLVHHTIVEQLSALTLIPVHEIDPETFLEEG